MTAEQKKWIDSADYESLLRLWRRATAGHPMFQGDTGQYYSKVMFAKRDAIGHDEAVRISKSV